MTLRFERFRHFPESGKAVTLLLGAVLGMVLAFTDLHYPKGNSQFLWACFWLSLLFDIVTIMIVLKEWDELLNVLRKAPYSVYHCLASLFVSFLIFMSAVLLLTNESYSGDGVLYVAAFFCFLIIAIRIASILKTLPRLSQDAQFPNRPSNLDYENHGTSII